MIRNSVDPSLVWAGKTGGGWIKDETYTAPVVEPVVVQQEPVVVQEEPSVAKEAQELATATGVSNNGSTSSYTAPASYTAPEYDADKVATQLQALNFGGDYINSDTSTVAGQLDSLLKSDSPYIKEARRSALEMSAGRGLQNTSIAAGSGERAAIQSGLPIAQQDAGTYASSDLATQGAVQALTGMQGNAIIEGALKEQDYTFQGTENAYNRAHELTIQDNNFTQQDSILSSQQAHETNMAAINYGYNESLQNLQTSSSELMQKMDLDYQESRDFQNMSTTIMDGYQTDVTKLLSDLNFLESSPETINSTMASLENITRNNINFAGSMAGIPKDIMDTYLSNAFA